ncbi:MAG: hypothetical protein HFE63_07705 [Clostridiales bacterium]|nr:hypothetical protein [Clostridiales bacterium]
MEQKKISSGAVRCFNAEFAIFLRELPQYLIIIVLFGVIYKFSDIMSPLYTTALFTTILALASTMQRYTSYLPQLLGYSISRKSYMNGGLLMKPVYMLFSLLMTVVMMLIYRISIVEHWYVIVFAAVFALFFSFLGDLLGCLIDKFSKWGFVIYMVCYVGIMFVFGLIFGIMAAMDIPLSAIMTQKNLILASIISAAIMIGIHVGVRAMVRNISVK